MDSNNVVCMRATWVTEGLNLGAALITRNLVSLLIDLLNIWNMKTVFVILSIKWLIWPKTWQSEIDDIDDPVVGDGTKVKSSGYGFLNNHSIIRVLKVLLKNPAEDIITNAEQIRQMAFHRKFRNSGVSRSELNEKLDNAGEEQQMLDKIVEDGKYTMPDQVMNWSA